MACLNSRFASVSELEILRIQEDAVPENTKRAINLTWKFSKDGKHLPTFNFRAVSGHVLYNHRFHQSKQTRPPSRSSPNRGRKGYRRVHRRKYQMLFSEAPPQVLRRKSLWKKTFSSHHIHAQTIQFQVGPSRTALSIFTSTENDNFDWTVKLFSKQI